MIRKLGGLTKRQLEVRAKRGPINTLKRWVFGEWRWVEMDGAVVGRVKSRRRTLVVDFGYRLAEPATPPDEDDNDG